MLIWAIVWLIQKLARVPDAAFEPSHSQPEIEPDTFKQEQVHEDLTSPLHLAATMQLATAMAMADGNRDTRETEIIAAWCADVKFQYEAFDATVTSPKCPLKSAKDAARDLLNASEYEKLEALYLCARIARADNKIEPAEHDLLNAAAEEMAADVKLFATMPQEETALEQANAIAEVRIGIQPTMSSDEKICICVRNLEYG